jgi:tryptophan synthase alpha chain
MSRIDLAFRRLRKKGRSALIPFVVAGDPDLETTEALILKMRENGADMIELGIPFSDPLLDGPIIRAASHRALTKGVRIRDIFSLTRRLKGVDLPISLMTYLDPVVHYGLEAFVTDCKESGVDGVIIPDLPPEEAMSWIDEARKMDLDTIFLLNPTSSIERIRLVNRCSRGFIYHASVRGLTGMREKLPDDLELSVKRVKENSEKPVAVGFGISTPEQANWISRFCDGVIVGSAIVKIIEKNLRNPDLITRVANFISSLSDALQS